MGLGYGPLSVGWPRHCPKQKAGQPQWVSAPLSPKSGLHNYENLTDPAARCGCEPQIRGRVASNCFRGIRGTG